MILSRFILIQLNLPHFKKFAFGKEFDSFLSCFDKTLEIIGMIDFKFNTYFC